MKYQAYYITVDPKTSILSLKYIDTFTNKKKAKAKLSTIISNFKGSKEIDSTRGYQEMPRWFYKPRKKIKGQIFGYIIPRKSIVQHNTLSLRTVEY